MLLFSDPCTLQTSIRSHHWSLFATSAGLGCGMLLLATRRGPTPSFTASSPLRWCRPHPPRPFLSRCLQRVLDVFERTTATLPALNPAWCAKPSVTGRCTAYSRYTSPSNMARVICGDTAILRGISLICSVPLRRYALHHGNAYAITREPSLCPTIPSAWASTTC